MVSAMFAEHLFIALTFKLQIWWLAMEEHNLDVHILTILVQEVLEKVTHRLVRDMTTDHYVPVCIRGQMRGLY